MLPRVCARAGCAQPPNLDAVPRLSCSHHGEQLLRVPVYLCDPCHAELAILDLDAQLVSAHN